MTSQLRALAVNVIYDVTVKGQSLNDSLSKITKPFKHERDKATLQAICFGVCRWYFQLTNIVNGLLEKPLKEKDQDIYILLLVGLYQLIYMRIPAYAAVADTVATAHTLKKTWAKGLVNAVLRNYQRQMSSSSGNSENDESHYSHPEWMISKIKENYPEEWESILTANNQHPPFTLRVNPLQSSRENYIDELKSVELEGTILPETKSGLIVSEAVDVQRLPGFSTGKVSVQDGAAQLAAELLELQPGQVVLDACAAPGGKTTHILEIQPDVVLIAVDQDEVRLASVKANLQRLHLSANCIAGDVADIEKWWDKRLFDRILLDAPCSASGVIRRHPDIKLLRRAEDIPVLAKQQLRLLKAMWALLKPGGLLVYATCSIFPEENTLVLQQFLAENKEAKEEPIKSDWGYDCAIGKQILPGMHQMDGFYFVRLRK